MDFFEVIKKRKAVRKYVLGKTMPSDDINKILETISLAPSAKNLQSYKIFVAHNKNTIEKIFSACFSQRSDFIKNASCIFIFCTDPQAALDHFGERGGKLYPLQDAAIAATYTILTAEALGYATCWVGNFKEDEIQKIVDTKLTPVSLIIIGYGDEQPERKPRKPLDLIAKFI